MNTMWHGKNFFGPDSRISNSVGTRLRDAEVGGIDDCVLEEVSNRFRFEDGVIFLLGINFGKFKAQFK